jgi:hypothetical protein
VRVLRYPGTEDAIDIIQHAIAVGGADLYVEERGTGEPLVLLHGMSSRLRSPSTRQSMTRASARDATLALAGVPGLT